MMNMFLSFRQSNQGGGQLIIKLMKNGHYNKRAWNKAKGLLNLPEDRQLTVHHLRHTFSSRLRDTDVREIDIDDLMGHKRSASNVRRRYSHANLVKLLSSISLIDTNRPKSNLFVVGQ